MNRLVLTIFLVFAYCEANVECPVDACPELYQEVGDQCFYISLGDECWAEARKFCVEMGAELAVPNDVDALKAFAFSHTSRRSVWIGGTDSAVEGDWSTYINGDAIQSSDWYDGQPSDYGSGEDCLEIRNEFTPPLNDYRCAYSQPFVCEVPRTPNIPTCPSPQEKVGDECFQVFTTTELNWAAARTACQDLGGDLASPCDVIAFSEWAFDKSSNDHVWIGATDANNEGFWQWLSGDPIFTEDWVPSEPNNLAGNEDCLEIRFGFNPPLNDIDCAVANDYACEFTPVYV